MEEDRRIEVTEFQAAWGRMRRTATTNWTTGVVKCELVRTRLLIMMGRFACTLSMTVALLEFVAYY